VAAIEHDQVSPATLTVVPEGIPDDLRPLPQFVCWDWEYRNDRWTKPPINPLRDGYAKSTDPATWATLDVALAAYQHRQLAGVGFALTDADPFFFVDLDHCRDAETGAIAPWAARLIRPFRHTYREVSPSGFGIKIIGRGRLPGDQHTKPIADHPRAKVEFFGNKKYTTLTGHRHDGAPRNVVDAQAGLDALYLELFPPTSRATQPSPPTVGEDDDDDRLERARNSKSGPSFVALFDRGDTSGHGGDASSADMALSNILAFWFGPDSARVERVFRRSALMRAKWDKKHHGDGRTYGQGTIDAAMAGRTEFYQPRPPQLRVIDGGQHGDGQRGAQPPPPAGPDGDRPEINAADANLERISDKAWAALTLANQPLRLFRFGGVPVRVEVADDDAVPVAQQLTEDRLGHELARSATWFKETERDGTKSASPPTRMIRDMLAAPSYPLPPLLSIVQTPVFAPDGSLHAEAGYHAAGRTYYAPVPGFVVPPVPDRPTSDDVARARSLIVDDLLGEFPFVGEPERANAVALFLAPYLRNMIDGPTPLHLIEAPTPGSGKGLLADVVLRPAVGRRVNVMPAANDDDEWRKRITAQLSLMPAAILIDNIVRAIDSGALSGALTATWWSDRRLGATEMVNVPVRCVWLATANNPTMSTELARRTVRIRLDPQMDRPWQRTGFRHEDLRTWADDRRAELVWSALVLGRVWINDGAPRASVRLGSFERWAAVMGGVLETAGISGFLANAEEFYEVADVEGSIWRQFVEIWNDRHGESEVGVSDLFDLALTVEGFDFGKGTERAQRISFGKALTKQRDRVIGDHRIVQARTVQRLKRWRLLRTRAAGNVFDTLFESTIDHPADAPSTDDEVGNDVWTRS